MVTIIVPVFNIEKWLPRCLNSVALQTYTDLQVILIDDGSTDNSGRICDDYVRSYPAFEVHHVPNSGLSSARNLGINYAKGDFLFFLDGDDYLAPNGIEEMVSIALENDADITICNFQIVDESGEKIEPSFHSPISNEILTPKEAFSKLYTQSYWFYIVAWNKLYKKSIFSNVLFPAGLTHEDEATTPKIFFNASRIATISSELYFYVQRSGSITHKKGKVQNFDACAAILNRDYFYSLNDMDAFIEKDFSMITNSLSFTLLHSFFNPRALKKAHLFIAKYKSFLSSKKYLRKRKERFKCFLLFHFLPVFLSLYVLSVARIKTRGVLKNCLHRFSVNLKLIGLSASRHPFALLMAPDHGNLGDQAILLAEEKFFKERFPRNKLVVFTDEQYEIGKPFLLKDKIRSKTSFFVHGGGFLGSLWPKEEFVFEDIVSSFPKSSIFILPQTLYFSSSFQKERFLALLNKRLPVLCLREKTSFSIFEGQYEFLHLIPDMVLICPPIKPSFREETRKGVLLCLRNDIEKTLSPTFLSKIRASLDKKQMCYSINDTVIEQKINDFNRKRLLNSFLRSFSKSRVIVTDRLHGMVFAWLSKTPCIVVNSKSPKLKGTYSWIKSAETIVFCDDADSFEERFSELLAQTPQKVLQPDLSFAQTDLFGLISNQEEKTWKTKTSK